MAYPRPIFNRSPLWRRAVRHLAPEDSDWRGRCARQSACASHGKLCSRSDRLELTNFLKTWLDERLFGWSHSAKRGTSAWAGSQSTEVSRNGTPDVSSDEEGDYDNVLGYLSMSAGTSAGLHTRSRSQQSSYANLQKLRKQPPNASAISLETNGFHADGDEATPSEHDGLHFRKSRVRKEGPSNGSAVMDDVNHKNDTTGNSKQEEDPKSQ